ncbi:DUF3037 domain-containing protein [Luteolibacter pohnpeiensis]|uniref:DUF3037 domain-containing protein n=1 Tax=Luteolibacter pohnpeiensis TaxID=454153 RepID=A0A934VUL7_9BACT|nr:DUF3037 domain-containing protein [Luteolibacter pohnpeiensis]MBK1882667.1 DUF3037 domain-containing protein [Luteolibacter pohnpeiensis]
MILVPYSFCFLRYVHEPLSGEFVNVGVLVWCPDKRYLEFRVSRKYRRMSHFFTGFSPDDYRFVTKKVEHRFKKLAKEIARSESDDLPFPESPESAKDLALSIVPHDDAALQWSSSGGGLTTDPNAELEKLFHEAVLRHYIAQEDDSRDDATIYREIYKRAFEARIVKPHIVEHEVSTSLASHLFPQAWKNGVWNVYQPLSFDLRKSDAIRTKAYQWESLTRFLSDAEEKPRIHLLLAAPKSEYARAYGKAKDILRSTRSVTLIEEDEVDDFAKNIERMIGALKLDSGKYLDLTFESGDIIYHPNLDNSIPTPKLPSTNSSNPKRS